MKNILYIFLILFQFIFSFDINNAKQSDWNKLKGSLSDTQITYIYNYIQTHGEIDNIYELQNIDGINIIDIQNIRPLVSIQSSNNEENSKKSRVENFFFHPRLEKKIFETLVQFLTFPDFFQ